MRSTAGKTETETGQGPDLHLKGIASGFSTFSIVPPCSLPGRSLGQKMSSVLSYPEAWCLIGSLISRAWQPLTAVLPKEAKVMALCLKGLIHFYERDFAELLRNIPFSSR